MWTAKRRKAGSLLQHPTFLLQLIALSRQPNVAGLSSEEETHMN